ncbi:MAG: carbamoyltransferase C-terminal domain-containing protein [Verrucomicrobiae bacterium]|nr:carbamoyltransferase C-terminal domain-containing protein [Verrucomicrobiae bacterium]
MNKYYVGIATTFHDPALAMVDSNGEVLFAEATERYLQEKRAYNCPADVREMVRRILKKYCDPHAEFVIAKPWSRGMHRLMEFQHLLGLTNHERLPRCTEKLTRFLVDEHVMFSSLWLQYISFNLSGGNLADILCTTFGNNKISYVRFPHHVAHAASACLTSPFQEAACMVVDGQGEWGAITYFDYRDGKLKKVAQMRGPESLGILYAICTELCGFSPEKGEEWKLMGLAPYGKLDPEIHNDLKSLVKINGLTFKYPPLRQLNEWRARMKKRARKKDAPALDMADFAFTTQFFYAEVMTTLLNNFHALGLSDNLILGGGCALNSSFNGQIVEKTKFKRLHVPSAPSDDGNALGCALLAYYQDHPDRKPKAVVQSPYLGSSIEEHSLANLTRFGRIQKMRHLPQTVHLEAARLLSEGKLLGWVQGRAEFGPRALGNRSILADPRPADMKDRINALVKFREEFRPFAPSILDEFGPEYFENYQLSPYMERTLTFKESAREKVPAIIHVNRTGRLQSVRREWNPRYYDLIRAFHDLTGVPMLLNTSFNIMGKPIIHSLEDALGLFYTTGLDALVIEDYLIEK